MPVKLSNPEFQERLSRLLRERDWGIQQLADASGLTYQTIRNLVKGQSSACPATLHAISGSLGVSYRYLVYGISGEQRRASRPIWITVIIVVLLGVAAGIGINWRSPVYEPQLSNDAHTIRVVDAHTGRVVIERRHDSKVRFAALAPWHDPDVLVYGLEGDHTDRGRVFACAVPRGNLLWESIPDNAELAAVYPAGVWEGGFNVYSQVYADMDGDGDEELVVSRKHLTWYPAYAEIFDRTGKRRGIYYIEGHIYDMEAVDIDDDGQDEIVIASTNNAPDYEGAMITVLDDTHCYGAACDCRSRLKPSLPDSALLRVIFPQFREPYGTHFGERLCASSIRSIDAPNTSARLSVSVGTEGAALVVTLDGDLHPVDVQASDSFDKLIHELPDSLVTRFYDEELDHWLHSVYRFTARPITQVMTAEGRAED